MVKKKFMIDIRLIHKQTYKNAEDDYNLYILILQEDKTTIAKVNNKFLEEMNNQESDLINLINSYYISINCNLTESASTCDETKSCKINNYTDFVYSFRLIINEKKLNSARANFCLKNKLNDITYTQKMYEINQPPKYKINNSCFTFIYPNITITHCFALSELLKTDKLNFGDLIVDENSINDSIYNKQLGLFFCGMDNDIGNGIKKLFSQSIYVQKMYENQ